MKILLAAINARYTHMALSVRYLRSALEDAGCPDVLLREYVQNQDRLEIIQDIALARPDVLMLSVYIWNSRLVACLLPDLRSLLPDCSIILGGPEVSYSASAWLIKYPEIDLVVSGAGESAVRELAACGFSLARYPDRTLVSASVDFSSLPLPYEDADFADFSTRYLYYESSRGCPYACSYCLSSNEGHALRMKSAERACGELDRLMVGKPILVKFIDRTFNADAARARRLWSHLAGNYADAGTCFHFEIHPDLLGEEDFALLERLPKGLFQFEIGVQSVHRETLKAIDRTGDWGQEKPKILRLLESGNIHIHVDLIAGLPGEGVGKIADSFDELLSLGADHVQMGFLKGLPGTRMAESADGRGMVFMREAPYEILRSADLSVSELHELGRIAELLENIGNTHRFDGLMLRQRERHRGWFSAYSALSSHCAEVSFDIRTRNEVKLRPLLESWAQAGS